MSQLTRTGQISEMDNSSRHIYGHCWPAIVEYKTLLGGCIGHSSTTHD